MHTECWRKLLVTTCLAMLSNCGDDAGSGSVDGSDIHVPGDAHPVDARRDDGPSQPDAGLCEGSPQSCGVPGMCESCTASFSGFACVDEGCGCNNANDCPIMYSCNRVSHQCQRACDTETLCHSGCCSSSTNGVCTPGAVPSACGATGGVCSDCAMASTGPRCNLVLTGGGFCGCGFDSDCVGASGSCAMTGGICSVACSISSPCSGGCCQFSNGTNNGTCALGTISSACGGTGGVCIDCTTSDDGHACIAGSICGCWSNADCGSGRTCDLTSAKCVQ